jgi:hypothetical protein
MKCKLCGLDNKLVKAHIIPEAFFRPLRSGKNAPLFIRPGDYVKRAPIGVYDKTILCEDCEAKFGVWDDYGQSLLIQNFNDAQALKENGIVYGYIFEGYNYDKLKLFFISVLWRASVSRLEFFRTVSLNVFEDRAKDHIQNNDPGSADVFSVMLARFDEFDGQRSILNPQPTRFKGINFFVFYLTGLVAYIKVDKRKITGSLRKFVMSPEQDLPIVRRPFDESQERRLLIKVAKSAK